MLEVSKHHRVAIHFNNETKSRCHHHDPIKMLLNRPKRSSLKKSCLLQSRKIENVDIKSNIHEVSDDDEVIDMSGIFR